MISIDRPATEPSSIVGAPTDGDHYNSPDVVRALWLMQHAKCCYCECNIPETGQGSHVEHYRPQEDPRFTHLRNKWTNLLLACSQCNGWKGDSFPTDGQTNPILIDPSSRNIDPENHIDFTTGRVQDEPVGLAMERNGSRRGRRTIEVVRLYNKDHCTARAKYYRKNIQAVVERMSDAKASGDATGFQNALRQLKDLGNDYVEFAGLTRAFIRDLGV